MSLKIISTGSYVPVNYVDKPEQIEGYNEVGDVINIFSGLGKRHVCNSDETPTFMGIEAAKDALIKADINPASIDAILCYSAVSDHETPRDIYKIAGQIGCDGAMCWTIDTACASFLSHLNCASALLNSGKKRVLLINSMNWVTRAFGKDQAQFAGDGSSAVIVEDSEKQHLICSKEISSTAEFDFITLKTAQVSGRREEIQFTKDRRIILRSVDILPVVASEMLTEHGISTEDIDWVICHQPGIPAIERWHESLGISIEKNLNTYSQFGNMSAANIPITLNYFLNETSLLQRDNLVLFFSGGAGIHVASALYRV